MTSVRVTRSPSSLEAKQAFTTMAKLETAPTTGSGASPTAKSWMIWPTNHANKYSAHTSGFVHDSTRPTFDTFIPCSPSTVTPTPIIASTAPPTTCKTSTILGGRARGWRRVSRWRRFVRRTIDDVHRRDDYRCRSCRDERVRPRTTTHRKDFYQGGWVGMSVQVQYSTYRNDEAVLGSKCSQVSTPCFEVLVGTLRPLLSLPQALVRHWVCLAPAARKSASKTYGQPELGQESGSWFPRVRCAPTSYLRKVPVPGSYYRTGMLTARAHVVP